ncbi:MAG: DUF3343 domain-containing protein [Eubacteriales bacterium]
MRKKEWKLVITFHTTTDAMAMEKACKELGAKGRLIPVPRAISAGCGMAWCCALEERKNTITVMKQIGIKEDNLHECMV